MKLLVCLIALPLCATPLQVPYNSLYDPANTRDNPGLSPFIGHFSFRNICDHIIDVSTGWFDPDTVQQGDLIYLNIWYLPWFADTVHDQIKHPYILVSGDVGGWYPEPITKKLLYDPKCAAWFCRNMIFSYHPKLFQIPMGQDLHLFSSSHAAVSQLLEAHAIKSSYSKEHLLYSNFYRRPHGDRDKIGRLFDVQPYCYTIPPSVHQLSKSVFYGDLASSKFALSPFGLESDCVRTWEAIVFDCIPIVEHSFLDPLLEGLPVLTVHDWTEINPTLLEQKYEELKDLNRDRAYFPYWEKLIKDTQTKVRNNDLAFTELDATLFSEEDIQIITSILAGSNGPLIYKGFASTLRPLQLSQHIPIELYDPWLDQNTYCDLCAKSYLFTSLSLLPSEDEFGTKTSTERPVSVFLDFTYYRTSLVLTFDAWTCHIGNFRHSLKCDLEDLYDDLAPGSLLFGNMGDEPYVKKVLALFAEDNDIQIQRHGPFWSLIKEQKTVPPVIQDSSIKNVVLVSPNSTLPQDLAKIIPQGGNILVVDSPKTIQHSGIPIDLIYLAGIRGDFVMYPTLHAWFPFFKKGSRICGDGWNIPDIQRDITEFSNRYKRIIHSENDFWTLH